jgi:hypothetical protein
MKEYNYEVCEKEWGIVLEAWAESHAYRKIALVQFQSSSDDQKRAGLQARHKELRKHAQDLEDEHKRKYPDDLSQYFTDNDEITHINYPVLEYPEKVKSLSLDKEPIISGKLLGIKGQYFLFDGNRVMNIRKHTSYSVLIDL